MISTVRGREGIGIKVSYNKYTLQDIHLHLQPSRHRDIRLTKKQRVRAAHSNGVPGLILKLKRGILYRQVEVDDPLRFRPVTSYYAVVAGARRVCQPSCTEDGDGEGVV